MLGKSEVLLVLAISVVAYYGKLGDTAKYSNNSKDNKHMYLRIMYLRECADVKPDTSIDGYYTSQRVYININFTLHRNMGILDKAILDIKRCQHAADFISCETRYHWRFGKEGCSAAAMKHALWTPLLQKISPPIHCAVKKGLYQLRNGSLDLTKVPLLPMDITKYYYRFRFEVFDPALLFCAEFGGNFFWSRT